MQRMTAVLALLLLVSAASAVPGNQITPGARVGPLPEPDRSNPVEMPTTDDIDAGYILRPVVEGNNGAMYGPIGFGSYSMGFKFKPLLSGQITAIGRYRGTYTEQSLIKVWDTNGNALASANVSGDQWSYEDITPIFVEAGTEYFITTHLGSRVYYYYINAVPWESNDIEIIQGAYAIGDAMPIYNAARWLYGAPCFYFEPVPETETWTGAVDDDWANGANWDGGYAPAAGINVIIPGGLSRYPMTNTGTSYGAKNFTIEAGGSLTLEAGKPLTVTDDVVLDGTLDAYGDVTLARDLPIGASGSLTINPMVTLLAPNITNYGSFTNNGIVKCPKDFLDWGTFTSGTFSEFHFIGHEEAVLAGGTDAGSEFYHLTFGKTGLDVVVGGDPNGGYNAYFGPWGYTMLASNPSTVAGDIAWWACYSYYSGYNVEARIYRANYNGYQWGVVTRGTPKTVQNGYNEFTETLAGVEPGDRIGAYEGGVIPFNFDGGMLIAFGDAYPGSNSWYDWGYGPLALAGYIQQPAGGVTATGDLKLEGDLTIEVDNEVTFSGAVNCAVGGMWTNNGIFHPGASTVTFTGFTSIVGAGNYDFHNLGITGTLYGPSSPLNVSGNWLNVGGEYDHGGGTVYFGGSQISGGGAPGAFRNLVMTNPTDGDIVMTGDLNVENDLAVAAGNLKVGAHTLTLGRAAGPATLTIDAGAGISVVGTDNDTRGTITAAVAAHPCVFTVHGAIAARYANFRWMGANGLDVRSGATIDTDNNFSYSSFWQGNAVGAMLKIANDDMIDDIVWVDFHGNQGYNIDYTAGTGHLTITDGEGECWGEEFENDPQGLVDWAVSRPEWPSGWVEVISQPGAPVRRGGSLTLDPGTQLIYATKGSRMQDFYCYDAINDVWNTLPPVPSPGRPLERGFRMAFDEEGYGYAVYGNNTVAFYRFDPNTGGWTPLPEVPAAPSGRRVRGGGDVVYVDGFIYSFKGDRNDFHRFDIAGNRWDPPLASPPAPRFRRDSFLVLDGEGGIYLHQARDHGFWRYDIAENTWAALPAGMPMVGDHGGRPRSKKARDGSSAAMGRDGLIYALKGGNTTMFYSYDIGSGTWAELPGLPRDGSSPRRRRVGQGGDIVHWGYNAFFALKGNRTTEFWRYVVPGTVMAEQRPERSGVMAGDGATASFVKVGPNPLTGANATLRYSLAKAGPVSVNVFDVSGRNVLSRGVMAARAGAVSLDLRSLSAGIYLIQVEAEGFSGTQKLVVQR